MRIVSVDIHPFTLELKEPFVIAIDTISTYAGVLVRVEDDQGHIGWGEAAPQATILGETQESVIAVLDIIAPRLIGEDPRRMDRITGIMDALVVRNTAAKAAVDIALYDLLGQAWEVPLWQLFGGARDRMETNFTISICSPEKMAREAIRLVEAGYRVLKLKLGTTVEEDVERVKAVRAAVGDQTRLRIDANQGWDRQEAIRALMQIARYNVELVEQPVAAADIEGLALVRKAQPIPVMADESIHQPIDVLRVIKEEAVDYINIKIMKSGGFWKAQQIAFLADAAGMECQVGGMVETDLGLAAAVNLACGLSNIRFGDLDMGSSFREKLIKRGGAIFENGCMVPGDRPGLGIEELNEQVVGMPFKTYKL